MAKIILIGGGSASGKTFVIDSMVKLIGEENITHISLDDYYKDHTNMTMEERCKINYDHPKSFDWFLIKDHLTKLKNDQPIDKTIYDYTIHNRSDKTIHIIPKKIVIVEGIMALVNKDVRNFADLKIFINASRETRLVRRIKRDQIERGRTYDSIINQYFASVQPMYEEIIGPSSFYADIIINNDSVNDKSIKALKALILAALNDQLI